jgi:hypothetical protein
MVSGVECCAPQQATTGVARSALVQKSQIAAITLLSVEILDDNVIGYKRVDCGGWFSRQTQQNMGKPIEIIGAVVKRATGDKNDHSRRHTSDSPVRYYCLA